VKTLKEKIAKAIAPRMETVKYGSRKGELEEKTSDYITITPEELSFLVRMRIVSSINVDVDVRAYVGDADTYFQPILSTKITKKMAKKIASDFARSAENYESRKDVDGPIMAKVYVSSWANNKLYISL
tara:strand:- start:311 stop:694 length:384 start_codon:yes stop_codon:yes gene_type:complete